VVIAVLDDFLCAFLALLLEGEWHPRRVATGGNRFDGRLLGGLNLSSTLSVLVSLLGRLLPMTCWRAGPGALVSVLSGVSGNFGRV
jgi:hypothetical protein